ncbi:MAG: hypothetical protein MK101_02225 [Phycisphaerales bacterium]|nr:hypothetical protein [Phycisphaerales bacterium]
MIWISPEGIASEEGQTLVKVLNLDPTADFYWLGDLKFQTPPTQPTESIRIRMRSFYGVMNFLAHAVEVPQSDKDEQRAIPDRPEEGGMAKHLFRYLGRILHIHGSKGEPENAFVAVKHRNTWFYIDDREVASKRAFTLAIELMNLEISGGPSTSPSPILTIPVG